MILVCQGHSNTMASHVDFETQSLSCYGRSLMSTSLIVPLLQAMLARLCKVHGIRKRKDTTALKVPGRSLSRVLVEPNPV